MEYNKRDMVELKDGRHVTIDNIYDDGFGVSFYCLVNKEYDCFEVAKEDVVRLVQKYDSLRDCITVEELITHLQNMPKDAYIILDYGDGHGCKGARVVEECCITKDYYLERYQSHEYWSNTCIP